VHGTSKASAIHQRKAKFWGHVETVKKCHKWNCLYIF